MSYLKLAILMIFTNCVFAQSVYKLGNRFELSASLGKNEFSSSVNWHHLHGIGKKQNLKIGYGLRFTSYFASNKNFVTAPARLTSGEEGPQVLFTGYKEFNFDTLHFGNAQVNYLNIFLVIQYTIFKKIDLGFNIDAIGFGLGGKRVAGYYSSKNESGQFNSSQSASPALFNLLLVSDNDLGNLNSELFVRYHFNNNWAIKAGAAFLFSEYITNQKLRLDNDRFRAKSLMLMLGIAFTPFI